MSAVLDSLGIDWLCERIAECSSLTAVAKQAQVSKASLIMWVQSNADRSARAKEVRSWTAQAWDEQAEHAILEASDPMELARARELASHYRWRASKIAPRIYGDKLQVEQDTKMVIQLVTFDSAGLPLVQDMLTSEHKQVGGDSSGSVGVALGNPTSTATHGVLAVPLIEDVLLKEHEQVSVDISEDEYKPVVMNMDSIPGREARLEKRRIARELARKARKDEYWGGRGYIWNGEKYVKDTRTAEQVVSDAKRKWDES